MECSGGGRDDGGAVHVWSHEVYGKSVPSLQVFCEPKTALRKSLKKHPIRRQWLAGYSGSHL